MQSGPTDRWQWFPPFLGFALGLATIAIVGIGTANFGDAADYERAANEVLAGRGYPRESSLPFFRAPLYPLLIAMLWTVAPESRLAVKLTQAMLFAGTCWLLYRLGALTVGSRTPALIGSTLYAADPLALALIADVQSETLHTFLVAAGVFLVTRLLLGASYRFLTAVLTGLALGLGALCRPTALPLGLALVLALFFLRRRPTMSSWRIAPSMLLGMAMALAPWTLSNWLVTSEVILINDASGYHLRLGNHPAAMRLYTGRFDNIQEFRAYAFNVLQQDLPRMKIAEWEAEGGYRRLSLRQRERRWRDAAFENMSDNPALTIRLWFEKTWAFWRPWLNPRAYPAHVMLAVGTIVGALYLLAAAGVLVLRRCQRSRQFLSLLAIIFIVSTAVHTVSHSMVRFRLPYIDPYICILAGVGLWALARAAYNRIPQVSPTREA